VKKKNKTVMSQTREIRHGRPKKAVPAGEIKKLAKARVVPACRSKVRGKKEKKAVVVLKKKGETRGAGCGAGLQREKKTRSPTASRNCGRSAQGTASKGGKRTGRGTFQKHFAAAEKPLGSRTEKDAEKRK